MFRTTRIGMAIALALGTTAVAIAQAPATPNVMLFNMTKDCTPPAGAARTPTMVSGTFNSASPAGSFNVALNAPAEVVEDAPYSGVGTTEMVTTLADGNRIVRKNTMRYYRDSSGRTRTEYQLAAVGPFALDEARSVVTINDPVAGQQYVLHEGMKRADVFTSAANADPVSAPMAGRAMTRKLVVHDKPGTAAVSGQPDVVFFAGPATNAVRLPAGAGCAPETRKLPQSVPLGERVIEGVKTIGSAVQFTMPAGEVGNEQPITVRSEQWFSPELRVVIASTHKDPLAGDSTYRLEQISRAEPDPALFSIPSDYTKTELPAMGTRVFGIGAEPPR